MRFAKAVFITLGLLLLIGSPGNTAEPAPDGGPRVAVMSAFAPEWQVLLAATQDRREVVLNGNRFVTGRLAGKDVVLCLSGVSMVNAAMTTQQLIDHFRVSSIVFSGIAGGVDPSLSIGDVVIADQWGEYLEAAFAREKNGIFVPPPFAKVAFANFGMIFPIESEVAKAGSDQPESRFWFPVDRALLETARTIDGQVSLDRCSSDGQCLAQAPRIVVGGNGVSGQAFVDNAEFRSYAFATFKARVLDMESAATAHVAYANGVPFIAFRSLSDLAGGDAGENQIKVFFKMASENSAKVVIAYLKALP